MRNIGTIVNLLEVAVTLQTGSFIFLVVIANEFKTSSFNVGVLLLILFSILVGLVGLFVTSSVQS